MSSRYVRSLAETLHGLSQDGISFRYMNRESSFVPSARELTALDSDNPDWVTRELGSGKFTYDWVLWVDGDMIWTYEDIQKLLRSAELYTFVDSPKVISALCISGPDRMTHVRRDSGDGFPEAMHADEFLLESEPMEVWGVGMAFLLVKSGVFESMPRPWFKIRHITWPHVGFETNVGEDLSWCISAREAGHQIWVDPLVRVGHHKSAIFRP